jgi:hypothetical protein
LCISSRSYRPLQEPSRVTADTEPHLVGRWEQTQFGDVPCLETFIERANPQTLLFLGDLHLDHYKSNRKDLKRVLDDAVEKEAAIILVGDVFDAMQGKSDRRANKAALRSRYTGRDDYLGAIVDDVSDFLMPYARNIWMVLEGNHESAITRWSEINLTRLLVHNLNTQGGAKALAPGYQTYAALKLNHSQNRRGVILPFFVTHGFGGASAVTGGAISMQRRAVTYPDAEFVVSGHLHRSLSSEQAQHRISQRGRVHDTVQEAYQVSAWKSASMNAAGFETERGFGPTIASGWWAEFYRARGENPVPAYRFWFYKAKP